MRSEQEAARAIARYGDTVQRLCTVHLKNQADTEDIFQTVFLKYVLHERDFADEEHEKAWFIRVTINACRDLLRSLFRRSTVPLDEAACLPAPPPAEHREVLEAVLALPGRYRDAGLTGWGVYFSPAAAISLDVNPSVELTLNRFDRVIGVTCYGVETEEAEGWQSLRFLDYRDAVDSLLGSGSIADCLAREEPLSISVASGDGAAQAEILENVRACAGGMGNVHCYAADVGQVEQARHAGVSFGKYQAFLYLQKLDPTVSQEEVQEMTMAEIRQRIAQLTGAESAPPGSGQGNGQGSGQSGGAQSGQGHGHGWGHGSHE